MALITCNECGAQISDSAKSCTQCGFSVGVYLNKSKIGAFALAFFLGTFGLHKFYLGNKKAGWIYLVFFWSGIPTILGWIDSLIILFKNQSEFSGSVQLPKSKPFKSTEKYF